MLIAYTRKLLDRFRIASVMTEIYRVFAIMFPNNANVMLMSCARLHYQLPRQQC